jgi:hypothetical protein
VSKFVDKLQSLSKSSASTIGFHPSAELKRSVLLLVAGLSGAKVEEAKVVAEVNADAGLIFDQSSSTKIVRQMVEAAGDVPLGVFVRDPSEEKINELVGSGCDFVVFDIKAAAAVLHKEGIGKILMIEPSLDQGFVRAINSLDVDGVLINGEGEDSFVAVEHLLIYRRFVELLERPVMITLPSLVTGAELGNLWQAGVDGIVVPPAKTIEVLAELKKMIEGLPRGTRGRRGKVGVMLPHYGGGVATEEDEEQEEEI